MSNETHQIKLVMDGKEIPNSVDDLAKAQRALRKELKGLEIGTKAYIDKSMQLNRVSKQLHKVRTDVNSVGKEWQKQKTMWDRAKATFAGTFAALSVNGAISSLSTLGTQLASFIKDLTKRRREITRLTDVTGRDLDVVSSKIQSIVDTYDKDFNEVLVAANGFAKNMNLNLVDALELMQQGFALGADGSDEFLSNLKEYPAQFKAAGLSAEQTIAIITQQTKTGVFSDKGADTIKEGTLRLREMTKATKDALAGIGISSDLLEEKLKNNSITYFEAIQMVARKLDELPPQSVKVGTALADIFGGAGEDAGLNYITMLGDINLELQKLENPTTRLAKANERLALAFQRATDDDGYLTRIEVFWKNSAAALLNIDKIFSSANFAQKMLMLINPAATISAISQAAQPGDSDTIDQSTVGPQPAPGFQFKPRSGNTPGSISAKTTEASKMGAAADALSQFTVLIETINSPDPFAGLTEATEKYENEFIDATKAMLDADAERTAQQIKNSELRTAKEQQELDQKRALIEATVMQGMMAAENAQSFEDYGNAAIILVRRQIQAKIAEGITNAIAEQLGTGPLGIITAGLAGIAAQSLFNQIVPSFYHGGHTGRGNLGLGRNNGGYIRGVVEEDEYVINKNQLRDPYVADFTRYLEEDKQGRRARKPMNINTTASLDAAEFSTAVNEFRELVVLLKAGVPAVISPRTIDDMDELKQRRDRSKSRGRV